MFAEEALQCGWANRVWPLEDFDREAADYIDNLTRLPTLNISAFKEMIDYSAEHSLKDKPRPRGPGLGSLPLHRRRRRGPPKLAREAAVGVPRLLAQTHRVCVFPEMDSIRRMMALSRRS